ADRRIQDRALAAWNSRWRITRREWIVRSRRMRIRVYICVILILFSYVWLFGLWVKDYECYVEGGYFIFCALSYLWEAVNFHLFGIFILWRVYLATFLATLSLVILWIVYRVTQRQHLLETALEGPGFALWIARNIRTCRPLILLQRRISENVIPFAFAVLTVVL